MCYFKKFFKKTCRNIRLKKQLVVQKTEKNNWMRGKMTAPPPPGYQGGKFKVLFFVRIFTNNII